MKEQCPAVEKLLNALKEMNTSTINYYSFKLTSNACCSKLEQMAAFPTLNIVLEMLQFLQVLHSTKNSQEWSISNSLYLQVELMF